VPYVSQLLAQVDYPVGIGSPQNPADASYTPMLLVIIIGVFVGTYFVVRLINGPR